LPNIGDCNPRTGLQLIWIQTRGIQAQNHKLPHHGLTLFEVKFKLPCAGHLCLILETLNRLTNHSNTSTCNSTPHQQQLLNKKNKTPRPTGPRTTIKQPIITALTNISPVAARACIYACTTVTCADITNIQSTR